MCARKCFLDFPTALETKRNRQRKRTAEMFSRALAQIFLNLNLFPIHCGRRFVDQHISVFQIHLEFILPLTFAICSLYMPNIRCQTASPCSPLHLVSALNLSAHPLSHEGYNWTVSPSTGSRPRFLPTVFVFFLATVTSCSLQRDMLVCHTYTHYLVFNPYYI